MSGLIDKWQHLPSHIDPVLVSLGPINIHWYGMMYVIAFIVTYFLILSRIKNENLSFSKEAIIDFLVWCAFGVLIGGRIGYVVFYDLVYFIANPISVILPFEFENGIKYIGIYGMSYHGGLIGVIIASILFCKKKKIDFWNFGDLVVPVVPLGYFFGRIGNFINGELYGRITHLPWGMYFPQSPAYELRHPSQLYEAFFEGIVLFIILWSLRRVPGLKSKFLYLYLIGYGVIRFLVEFFREPDAHIGYVAKSFTLGQVLSLSMAIFGFMLVMFKRNKKNT